MCGIKVYEWLSMEEEEEEHSHLFMTNMQKPPENGTHTFSQLSVSKKEPKWGLFTFCFPVFDEKPRQFDLSTVRVSSPSSPRDPFHLKRLNFTLDDCLTQRSAEILKN